MFNFVLTEKVADRVANWEMDNAWCQMWGWDKNGDEYFYKYNLDLFSKSTRHLQHSLIVGRWTPDHRHNDINVGVANEDASYKGDNLISRKHFKLVWSPMDNTITIVDLNSTNGTFVDGVRISKPTILKHEDIISVGNTELIFTDRVDDPWKNKRA